MALGFTACGDDDDDDDGGGGGEFGDTATIYSSLPLQGANRPQTTAMVQGMELALEQAGNQAGDLTIEYESLDGSTAQAGQWTPEATSANARRAAQDDSAIGYIGEFNSGASAVSMPILNEGGLAQISPANTAVGLTSDEPGADAGEPDKYYPTGERHYARIVPKDTIQAAALVTTMADDGCENAFMTNDKEVYGAGLARNIEIAAEDQGLEILANEGIDKNAANYRSLAQRAASADADCFVYSGIIENNAVQIFKDFAAALPNADLYGPDGVALGAFADPDTGVPPDVGARTKVTVATLEPGSYPPEGQAFFDEYNQKYNVRNPDPYAIYGYEAMNLMLDAIARAQEEGELSRQAVIDQVFATEGREGVLGTYDIDENGDTTLTTYGVYRIEDGALAFDKAVEAQAGGGE